MEIRKATLNDWNELERIFGCARAFMQRNGNGTQWVDGYPSEELVARDITNGDCYCLVGAGGRIAGTFTFISGEDPNYKTIYNGSWPNDKPYGTIHRLASDGSEKGVADACFGWCGSRFDVIRADTHRDNTVLRHLLAKYGFRPCGTVRVANGTERLAFQWERE